MNPQTIATNVSPFFDNIDLPFIEANTLPISLEEIERSHIIPVFTKDNQPLISQRDFIQTTYDILSSSNGSDVLGPFIRVSHPVKGRIPSARYKKAQELLPEEVTIYNERLMFVFVLLSFTKVVNGQELKLVIGGVKAYNQDNLNKNGNSLQQFTFFIGFQVKVCSNLCVWSDGFNSCIKVNTLDALGYSINSLITSYNPTPQLELLESLSNYSLTEREFAHFIGKCRMSNYLDKDRRNSLIPSGLTETQLSYVTKAFYHDESFSSYGGSIDFWNLYNLFTGALKTSYIDTIVNNNVQVCQFFGHLKSSLDSNVPSWYLL